ncbi:MAG: wax ester/triacylglycerol synthase family O-acyltransferase [Acidimicrobiales bacterium]|nr:wax ester/triacylglycerol synthase family O-acyltransferase [Acidimicrobiales bacterium]
MALMDPTDLPFVVMEARERPMHVGGLQLFTTPEGADWDYVRGIYESALEDPTELHPLLSRRPGRTPIVGRLQWEVDQRIDLSYHVRHSGLARPGRIRELLEVVGRLHGTLLDRNRPLWEAHLIEGLDDGRFAVYTKIHHALVDGVSAMRMLSDALSTDPDERDMPPPWAARSRVRAAKTGPAPSTAGGSPFENVAAGLLNVASSVGRMGFDVAATAGRFTDTIRDGLDDHASVLPYQAPETMLNVPITGARRFAAQSWDLERIRAAGQRLGGTLNDAVLAMCGGALRRYLAGQGALPDDPLIAMVPVSLRAADDSAGGNAVGVILANLATHTDSGAERFGLVKASMDAGKARFEGLSQGQIIALSAISFVPMATSPLFRFDSFRRPPYNITISNVPGPKETRYWNGARMDGSYPVSIPMDGQALNITLSSYDGSIDFGLIGDRNAVPSLQNLLEHLEESLVELEDA